MNDELELQDKTLLVASIDTKGGRILILPLYEDECSSIVYSEIPAVIDFLQQIIKK